MKFQKMHLILLVNKEYGEKNNFIGEDVDNKV